MLELVWKGKKEVLKNLIQSIEIQEVEKFEVFNDSEYPTHKIFEGDNLKILNHFKTVWENKFKIIYIDPPYNTGSTDFYYHDKFKSQSDDDSHTSWLNFIYPRLQLAKKLLHQNGAIFISIDDYELYHLKLICDEVFGSNNFVANMVRLNKSGAGHDSKKLAVEYDYVLCYAKDYDKLTFSKEIIDPTDDPKYRYSDKHVKKRGKYYLRDLDYRGSYSKTLDYQITAPDGSLIFPGGKHGRPNTWRWGKSKFEWGFKNDFIVFKKRPAGYKVYIKQYQFVDNNDKPRKRTIPHRALVSFLNSKGSTELKKILDQSIFSYPKPVDLIKYILGLFKEDENLEVLDFFAGSGTTLQAVMEYNKQHKLAYSCTLINNNENNICEEVTYLRNAKLIKGFTSKNGKKVEGLNQNNLRYFRAKHAGK